MTIAHSIPTQRYSALCDARDKAKAKGRLVHSLLSPDWEITSKKRTQSPGSFENSWLGVPPEGPPLGFEKRITVKPFIGDQMMAERWTTVFQNLTDRRVVSARAQSSSAVSGTDCILTGYVVTKEQDNGLMGLKQTSSHRLYLRLTTDSGALLWKTELPYTIVKGPKVLEEKRMIEALLAHVRLQTNEIGLDELATRSILSCAMKEGHDLHESKAIERVGYVHHLMRRTATTRADVSSDELLLHLTRGRSAPWDLCELDCWASS